MELLKKLCGGFSFIDLKQLSSNQYYISMIYCSLLKNYLIESGLKPEEIEKLSLDEVEEIGFDIYTNSTLDINSWMMARCIVDNIDYIDIEAVFLIIASLPLMFYSDMTLEKVSKNPIEEIPVSDIPGRQIVKFDSDVIIDDMKQTEVFISNIILIYQKRKSLH